MQRFTERGMLIIPNPTVKEVDKYSKALVIGKAYCHNGHDLIDQNSSFNGHPGIRLKVIKDDKEGVVILSPFYGDNTRVTCDVQLQQGDHVKLCCPTCGEPLPTYSPCECDGHLVCFFPTPVKDFANSIGICDVIDCYASQIMINNEVYTVSMIESF